MFSLDVNADTVSTKANERISFPASNIQLEDSKTGTSVKGVNFFSFCYPWRNFQKYHCSVVMAYFTVLLGA